MITINSFDKVTCCEQCTALMACATINCNHTFTDLKIRLVGGSSYTEGRVEVNYNGEWGTVCDDGWDDTDAGVVCRQLGFGPSGMAIRSAGFGQGSGSIWPNNVTCTGSELSLTRCKHFRVNITQSCDHSKDAGVRCPNSEGMYLCIVIITKGRQKRPISCLSCFIVNIVLVLDIELTFLLPALIW